ncbi:tetratricopeptide repeat protein [Sulfurimonas paralvinellae]|uniref:Flagellar protein n=1 Tax=Sulfurimonas paralvinellae TaxID=317658 RepID=A0A7M1B9M8_9BACT|nr:flagellar protein [Sulfurimonas paralvinellae]QOP46365.1 flagellar protein [Sulfurimonas paralvinellae]
MYRYILLAFITLNAFALEISIESAKDNFTKYSILLISDKSSFVCQELKDDLDVTKEIVCAFSKKPAQLVPSLQNDFFIVHSFTKKDTFFVSIKPFYKMKLIANVFDLSKDDTVFTANVKMAKSWTIIGYKKVLPLIKQESKSELALNFPFFLDKDKLPYVGSLDLQGNPVKIKKVEDVTEYLKIKRFFKKKRYDEAIEMIDDVLSAYPHTLFKSELIYYKIKINDKIKNYDNVIALAKEFLREYSSDENVPEVLSLMAKAYAKIGQNTDADYFFDRLFSEHKGNVYAQWGYIYKGEMLESSGANKEAIKYYKKALYTTKNLEVAASAAFHLTKILISHSPKEAAKYAMKIIQAKPDFFMENIKASMKIMQTLADAGEYKTAAAIADTMLHSMGPTYDEYEELLKDKALWLAKTKDKKAALAALNSYIKKFPDGDYIDDVQTAKDGLFFEDDDQNSSVKLAEYDKLIQEYQGDFIADKALYEKAKLLLREKRYEALLAMEDELKNLDSDRFTDVGQIIKEAAVGLMESSLQKKNCKNVLVIANDYNITLSNSWDDGIYECGMKGGDFKLCKSVAFKHLKSKNIQQRKKWLYRYIKIDFETGNYSEVVDAAKDLIALIENAKKSPYKEVYRYLFDAYERLEQKENMIKTMAKIEDIFGLDYKDIDRYVAMVNLGDELKDDNMIIKYATKVMRIQKRSHSHAQSPFIEFALYSALMNKHDYNKALSVIRSLDTLKLSKNERARQKYLLGMALGKLWRDEEAQKAYNEAIKADPSSAWAKLAKSALEI